MSTTPNGVVNLEGQEGVVLTAISLDYTDFSADQLDENDQLNPELIEELYSLLFNANAPDTLDILAWSSDDGLVGLAAAFDQSVGRGGVYYFLLLDTGSQYILLFCIAAADSWDDYEAVVVAIFNTAHRINVASENRSD